MRASYTCYDSPDNITESLILDLNKFASVVVQCSVGELMMQKGW